MELRRKQRTALSSVRIMKHSAATAKKSGTDKLSSEKYSVHEANVGTERGKFSINSYKNYILRN